MKTNCPVLPREKAQVSFDVLGGEGDPIHHRVEGLAGDQLGHLLRLADIALQEAGVFRHRPRGLAAI